MITDKSYKMIGIIKKELKKISKVNLFLYSISIAFLFYYFETVSKTIIIPVETIGCLIAMSIAFLPASFVVNVIANKLVKNRKEDVALGLVTFLVVSLLSITIPLATFWNNPGEFDFSAGKLIYVNMIFIAMAIVFFPLLLLVRTETGCGCLSVGRA